MKIINSVILLFVISIWGGCTKPAETTSVNTNNNNSNPTTGSLFFHLHTNVDTNEVAAYNTTYVITGGRKILVSTAQLLISNIQLVRSDSTVYNVPNAILLKTQSIEPYFVGNIPPGNYITVRFTVGIDSATNAKIPTNSDTSLNNPTMWFNTPAQSNNNIFVKFEGAIDTTASANGSLLIPFMYDIGTNANARIVSMPYQTFTITTGQSQYVHMILDYYKLFQGVNIRNGNNLMIMSTSSNASALAKNISNNIPSIFTYE